MNENTYNILIPILKDFAFFTSFVLFFLSLIVGLLLLLRPSIIIRLNHRAEKKFSLRRATKCIDVPKDVDSMIYRHHRILGAVVVLTSAYVLYYFLVIYDAAIIDDYLKSSSHAVLYGLMISAGRLFMLISSAAIVLLGIAIFVRPGQIKLIENWANRWVSTRKPAEPLSVDHDNINQLVYNHPKILGSIIIILSLYASIFLFFVYNQ